MPTGSSSNNNRNTALDGLRGVAALSVALTHFVRAFYPAMLDGDSTIAHRPAETWFSHSSFVALYNGDFAVGIFFVLSGFVLAGSVSRGDAAAPFRLPGLVARRWIRLFVPILGTTVLIWLLAQMGPFPAAAIGTRTHSAWVAGSFLPLPHAVRDLPTLLRSAGVDLMFAGPYGASSARLSNGNLWTMPIEFQASLGLYAGYVAAHVARLGVVLRLAFAIAVIMFAPSTPFSAFACGIALFELSSLRTVRSPHRVAACAGPLMLLAGVWLGGVPYAAAPGGLYDTVVRAVYGQLGLATVPTMKVAGAVLMVAAALSWRPFRTVLQGRVCDFLGRISFMLYLVQIPILGTVGGGAFLLVADRLPYPAATLVVLVAYIGATLAVAAILTRVLDRPAIRLSRRAAAALDAPLARLFVRAGGERAAASDAADAGRGRAPEKDRARSRVAASGPWRRSLAK